MRTIVDEAIGRGGGAVIERCMLRLSFVCGQVLAVMCARVNVRCNTRVVAQGEVGRDCTHGPKKRSVRTNNRKLCVGSQKSKLERQ